jgi:hypothetical protein
MYSIRCLIEMVGVSNMSPHFNLIHPAVPVAAHPCLGFDRHALIWRKPGAGGTIIC